MIYKRLENAIEDIDALIELTSKDIADIKEAKHENLSMRLADKERLISSFEQKKALLNSELSNLVNSHDGKPMEEILTSNESDALEIFKDKLSILKNINKEYAKFVATISEFYNSLIDKMFTLEGDGYEKNRLRSAAIFSVSA